MAYGDSWHGRRDARAGYGGSTPRNQARDEGSDDESYGRRGYSPANRGDGQPRGGHTEWGMGSPGGFGHSDPRVHRGSYGGYRQLGNRGDYSYDSGSAESYDFFGDQGNRVPSGFGGVTGPYASDFGSGYERSATRGITRAGGPGRGSRVGMSGNYRGEQGGRFEGDWYGGADYGDRGVTGAPPGGRRWPVEQERTSPSGAMSNAYAPNYAGRGPRGYTRSDARIEEDVCEALTQDAVVDASDVEVHVTRGTVHLSGRVDDRQSRWRAEDLAEQVAGVRTVRNELRIGR